MFVIYGKRSAGRIYTDANELLSTVFFHAFFLPLVPMWSVRVREKGHILDEGDVVPLNKKSILAGYLRTTLFGIGCLGFSMTVDGLFLDSVVEADKPSLIMVGATIFSVSSILWLLAMYQLGAPREAQFHGQSWFSKVVVGLLGLAFIFAILFGGAHFMPEEPTLESISANRELTDDEAVLEMAKIVLPEKSAVEVSRNGDGIELSASYLVETGDSIAAMPGLSSEDVAQMHKASLLVAMRFRVKNLIVHGSKRGLSRIRVSMMTTTLGEDGKPVTTDMYRVNITKDKFRDIADASTDDTSITPEVVLRWATELEAHNVVEVDNIDQLISQR